MFWIDFSLWILEGLDGWGAKEGWVRVQRIPSLSELGGRDLHIPYRGPEDLSL